jgi:multiple sugar transport system ATP-binding protein
MARLAGALRMCRFLIRPQAGAMASLTFEKVSKTYDDGTRAVANTSLHIADGEFVVLVGPSGCGKSTLLRIAAGLEKLNGGRLLLGGADVSNASPRTRDIAMIFQGYALYPHLTVFENMAFALRQRRTPPDEIGRRVQETAQILDITGLLERKPGALSGGQRQRVAMGRAIVRHPAAFLMDEPLSNLDAKLRVQMRAELKLLNARLGVTTLYVTHDQVEAMTMGDRVAVLKPVNGAGESNLQQIDTPQTLYDRPTNLFVAGFIGSPAMNFLRLRLNDTAKGLAAELPDSGLGFTLPPTLLARRPELAAHAGREVIAGIRPEAFRVASGDRDGEDPVLAVEALVTESLGPDSYVFFSIDASAGDTGRTMRDSGPPRITARVPPERAPRRGERITLAIDRQKIYWFDAASGVAIG